MRVVWDQLRAPIDVWQLCPGIRCPAYPVHQQSRHLMADENWTVPQPLTRPDQVGPTETQALIPRPDMRPAGGLETDFKTEGGFKLSLLLITK